MEKSTGLALIALVLSASSFTITFMRYVPGINEFGTTLYDHKDITILEQPFSGTYAGEAGWPPDPSNFYFTVPSVDQSIVARAIMVTVDYQFMNMEGHSFQILLVKEKDQGSNPSNVIASSDIDINEQTMSHASLSTGFLSPSTPFAELQFLIDPYAIGSMNGTITQIIIR